MFINFFRLGKTSVKKLISCLFFMGFVPLLYLSYAFGKHVYLTNTYAKVISEKNSVVVTQEANNIYIGIIAGVIAFIFCSIIWKLICELLMYVFTYLESKLTLNMENKSENTESNKSIVK